MIATELEPIEQKPEELQSEVMPVLAWARALAVTTAEGFAFAAEKLQALKGYSKRVEAMFKPMKQRADEAKREILDQERKLTGPLAEAERLTKAAMQSYQQQERDKAIAEQRRLQAISDERVRKEREKRDAEIAKQREAEAAARAKAEDARRQAELASAEDRKKLLAQASAADRKAEKVAAKAEEIDSEAIVAPVITVPTAAPRVSGISTVKTWKARVVNRDLIPRTYMIVDDKALNALAKALRERADVPGVEFYSEEVMASRSK